MEEIQPNPQTAERSPVILPPHSNKLAMSIICTIFCCLISGIIAIVYSAKSNSYYNSAVLVPDEPTKMNLYYQSESYNNTAQTWNIVSIVFGVLYVIAIVIVAIANS